MSSCELAELPPFTVVPWLKYLTNPEIITDMFPRGRNDRSDHFTDMTDDDKREIKIENEEELSKLTETLITKPILLFVFLVHQRKDNYAVVEVTHTWAEAFAVLVNTQHDSIREILHRRMLKARDYMNKGKHFCVKFNFEKSVRDWFNRSVDDNYIDCGCCSKDMRPSCTNTMAIYIHNFSIPVRICMNPCLIFWCCPFWLVFGGSCYFAYRKIKCIDKKETFPILPVMLLTAPLPPALVQQINHRVPGGRRVTPLQ